MTFSIKNNPSFKSYGDVNNIIASFEGSLNINYFGYCRVFPNKEFFNLSNTGEWPEEYFIKQNKFPATANNYSQVKSGIYVPTIDQDKNFGWPENTIKDIRNKYNIIEPLLIIKKYDDCINAILIAINHKSPASHLISNIEEIVNFLHYFQSTAIKIIKSADSNRISLSSDSNNTNINADTSDPNDSSNTQNLPQKYYLRYLGKDISITEKESACLKLLAHGYSMKNIAVKLHISSRTVETNINKIKSKFNMTRKYDLVKLFWDNKFL
ncbi:MAG: helix-turn-helix transcriptional regulator [Gammaproteobacteria bacterium]|nr:helix-turn-helix transcriptional regulator [Gammaproteobacteria bacterium]